MMETRQEIRLTEQDNKGEKMKYNFIRTSNPMVAARLRAAGFMFVSERKGISTFVNDPSKPLKFEEGMDFVYTNKLEV